MTPVDVLLVNYRTPDLARQALTHVHGPGLRLLAHDNSGDLPEVLPVPVERFGDGSNLLYARANNILFGASESPLVLLLNPDVVLPYESLCALVAVLEADRNAWGAAPALRNPDGTPQNYVRRLPTLSALLADRCPPLRPLLRRQLEQYYCRDLELSRDMVVEQPAAACLLIRRDRARPMLFDEAFPLFFNDTDLARRLNHEGHCLYVAGVQATHYAGASIERARDEHRSWVRRQYDRSLLRYARRHLRGWQLLVPVIAVRALVAGRAVAPPSTPVGSS